MKRSQTCVVTALVVTIIVMLVVIPEHEVRHEGFLGGLSKGLHAAGKLNAMRRKARNTMHSTVEKIKAFIHKIMNTIRGWFHKITHLV